MSQKPVFPGFPEGALKFFRSLERNNRREWFQPRKQIFDEQVRGPMLELIQSINLALARFAPDHVTEPDKSVYRIYRDTRFSSDKTPYKTHIAGNFWRRGFEKHASAGFYVSISHQEIEVAGGVYMPGPDQLLAIRRHIAGQYAAFRKLTSNRKLVALMGPLQGESLSRVPKGFPCEHPAAEMLKMKQWLYYTGLDPSIATTPALYEEVLARFRAMNPVVEFLNAALLKNRPKLSAADLFL